jgi:hypothetical protein
MKFSSEMLYHNEYVATPPSYGLRYGAVVRLVYEIAVVRSTLSQN